jgi:hypothetical protein
VHAADQYDEYVFAAAKNTIKLAPEAFALGAD